MVQHRCIEMVDGAQSLSYFRGSQFSGICWEFGCVASMKFPVDTMNVPRIAKLRIRERIIEFSLMT